MTTYSKVKTPPADAFVGQTPTGLKYWSGSRPELNHHYAVTETEDPDIYMVEFLAGRDHSSTCMFHYKGFRMGFLLYKAEYPGYSGAARPFYIDRDTGRYWQTIHHVGTPVTDFTKGEFRRRFPHPDKPAIPGYPKECDFLTGITWDDYIEGQRTKFPSVSIRDEMMEIWLPLLNGFYDFIQEPGNIEKRKSQSSEPLIWVDCEFSPEALKEMMSAEMVNG